MASGCLRALVCGAMLLLCVVGTGLSGGCAASIPRFPPASAAETLETVSANFAKIASISGPCRVTLVSEAGDSITLDAAIAAVPPSKLRIRAWKFDRAVFDATIIGDDVWVLPIAVPAERAGSMPQLPTKQLSQAFGLLGPAYFKQARVVDEKPAMLTVVGPGLGDSDLVCEIERATRTPRRFVAQGNTPVGGAREVVPALTLEAYQFTEGVAWPSRLRFVMGRARIVIDMRGVTLNGEVEEAAFVPPKRAERSR